MRPLLLFIIVLLASSPAFAQGFIDRGGIIDEGGIILQPSTSGSPAYDTLVFGDSTTGGSSTGFDNTWSYANGYQQDYHTASSGDSIIWVHVQLSAPATGGPHTVYIGLYDISGTEPNSLIALSGAITFADGVTKWDSVAVNWGLTAGIKYTLGFQVSGTGSFSFYYDAATPADSVEEETASTLQNPWGGSRIGGNGRINLFATYVRPI